MFVKLAIALKKYIRGMPLSHLISFKLQSYVCLCSRVQEVKKQSETRKKSFYNVAYPVAVSSVKLGHFRHTFGPR